MGWWVDHHDHQHHHNPNYHNHHNQQQQQQQHSVASCRTVNTARTHEHIHDTYLVRSNVAGVNGSTGWAGGEADGSLVALSGRASFARTLAKPSSTLRLSTAVSPKRCSSDWRQSKGHQSQTAQPQINKSISGTDSHQPTGKTTAPAKGAHTNLLDSLLHAAECLHQNRPHCRSTGVDGEVRQGGIVLCQADPMFVDDCEQSVHARRHGIDLASDFAPRSEAVCAELQGKYAREKHEDVYVCAYARV